MCAGTECPSQKSPPWNLDWIQILRDEMKKKKKIMVLCFGVGLIFDALVGDVIQSDQ